jgi:hypothetical protein
MQCQAELEEEDLKTPRLIGGGSLDQHVGQCSRRLAGARRSCLAVANACRDLAFGDLQPRREQPLQLVPGPEHSKPQVGDGLPTSQPACDQFLKSPEVGRQRGNTCLDRLQRQRGRFLPPELEQVTVQARDLRRKLRAGLVTPRPVGRGKQHGRSGNDAFGRARELERRQGGQNTRIDNLEPVANLAEGVEPRSRG